MRRFAKEELTEHIAQQCNSLLQDTVDTEEEMDKHMKRKYMKRTDYQGITLLKRSLSQTAGKVHKSADKHIRGAKNVHSSQLGTALPKQGDIPRPAQANTTYSGTV